jgi:hypothetical protein
MTGDIAEITSGIGRTFSAVSITALLFHRF